VLVFDPLAIALILASTQGMAWERIKRKEPEDQMYEPDSGPLTTHQLADIQAQAPQPITDLETINSELNLVSQSEQNTDELEADIANLRAQELPETDQDQALRIEHLQTTISELEQQIVDNLEVMDAKNTELTSIQDQLRISKAKVSELEDNLEINHKKIEQLRSNLGTVKDDTIAKDSVILELTEKKTELEQALAELHDHNLQLNATILELESKLSQNNNVMPDPEPGPEPLPLSIIPELRVPSVDLDITSRASNAGFGNQFPLDPVKGDMFVKVDVLPNMAYKYNGSKWIEVDKANTDSYLQNTDYVQFLVERLSSGELELDQLTEAEQAEVKRLLKKENVLGK
jgi:hypothetical protein